MPRPPTFMIWIGMRSKSIGDAGLAKCMIASTSPGTQTPADVVLDERGAVVAEQLLDVGHGTGDEVVDRHDTITVIEQRPAEVRAEEAGAAGDDDAGHGQRPMPWYAVIRPGATRCGRAGCAR